EVRREWARRSRGWRCEVCAGGRTNEELLVEWREVCREKGVKVDEEENGNGEGQADKNGDVVPDGLRFGYKDDQGRVQDIGNENKEQEASKDAPESQDSSNKSDDPLPPESSESSEVRARNVKSAPSQPPSNNETI